MRWSTLTALLGLAACGSATVGGGDDDDGGLDPSGDEDGDGFTNGEESAGGTDPYDAEDVPYAGGWRKDVECNDSIEPTGDAEGQVASDFVLTDQYGEDLHLHDFCGRVVLLEFGGFT